MSTPQCPRCASTDPAVRNRVQPVAEPRGGLFECADLWHAFRPGQAALGVLNSPTPPAPLPATGSPSLPIDGVRDWYIRYLELKDAEAQIKARLDEAKSVLMDSVQSRFPELPDKLDLTIDGKPVLRRHVVHAENVDVRRLRAERPDIAQAYRKTVTQTRLNIL